MHIETPLVRARTAHGQTVWLKMESAQPVGSFKQRGIGALCKRALQSGARHFVSSSGGNAGLAAAWSGRALNVPVTVVTPTSTPQTTRGKLADLGAKVVVHGEDFDAADVLARTMADADPQTCYITPFDDSAIWSGHATMIAECAARMSEPDWVVVSVGGGGLLRGVHEGMQSCGWNCPILAVETEGAASYRAALESGGACTIDSIRSIANTLGARRVAQAAFEVSKERRVISALVTDDEAIAGSVAFASSHRVLVEPACGAALAAVAKGCASGQDILLIVCGGAGVDLSRFAAWGVDYQALAQSMALQPSAECN